MKNTILAIILVPALFSCRSTPLEKEPARVKIEKKASQPLPSMLKNPRLLEGELILRFHIKKRYSNAELAPLRKKMNLDWRQKPALYLWCAEPTDQYNQEIKGIHYSLPPVMSYEDEENGNRIAFWNLSSRLDTKINGALELRRRITLIRYETAFRINPEKIKPYDTGGDLYRFYTKSEPGIELTTEIRRAARKIVGEETNPHQKARKIFQWLLQNLSYKFPPEKRGAKFVFQTREGDCGEYAYCLKTQRFLTA